MVQLPFSLSRAVVISLPGSDRRPGFFAQPLGEIFEVFDAFHGATEDWSPYFDAERFERHYLRRPEPAEIGCAISHAWVIREFAAGSGSDSDLLLVAEDDARFTEDFPVVLRAVMAWRAKNDVMVLGDGWTRNPRLRVRRQIMASSQVSLLSRLVRSGRRLYRLGRYAGHGDCAGLYLLTRGGARKFDAYVRDLPGEKLQRVADAWSEFREEAGLDVALLRPSLATWSGGSTIRPPEVVASEEAEEAAAPGLHLRDRLALRIAVRSRLRGVKLAVWATVDDVRHRMRAARGL